MPHSVAPSTRMDSNSSLGTSRMKLVSTSTDNGMEKAIDGKGRPRARYRVARSATLMITTRKLLPDPAFDAFLRSQFPTPGS